MKTVRVRSVMVNPSTVLWLGTPRWTAEQFRAQFDTRVEIAPALRNALTVERTIHGYVVYRLLDRLLLLDPADGQFYIHARAGEWEHAEDHA